MTAFGDWLKAHRDHFAHLWEGEDEDDDGTLFHDPLCWYADVPEMAGLDTCIGCLLVAARSDAQYENEELSGLAIAALKELGEVVLGHAEDVQRSSG